MSFVTSFSAVLVPDEPESVVAVILPPVPAFYHRPVSLNDIIDHTVTKILDQFGIDAGLITRWQGLSG